MTQRIVTEKSVATATHGRYLVRLPAVDGPAFVIVGFHGYGENADIQLERLCSIPGIDSLPIVSIQALHRFYERRSQRVVASWMTRQDRELAMADNLAYVRKCIGEVCGGRTVMPRIVFAGFSQGVAMAFRAAVHVPQAVAGVIAVGGDVPPELSPEELRTIPAALICRGRADGWYTPSKFADDERRLRESGAAVQTLEFDGGHEWSAPVNRAAAEFLAATRG